MKLYCALYCSAILASICQALPVKQSSSPPKPQFPSTTSTLILKLGAVPRSVFSPDGDDKVVYTWALPEQTKRSEGTDGDDKVVYTWAVPEERRVKRSEADGDDKVVYAWAVPGEKRSATEDGDDKVVYTWAVPEKGKRGTDDGDDKVVYAWAVPEE